MPRGLVPLLSATNFVIGMGAFVVIGALGPLSRDLDLSAARAGWVMTAYALAYAVTSPVIVSLTGRFDRRAVVAAAMALFALGAAASALAPTEGALYAARVLAALGAGLTTPVTAAVAANLAPPERRGTVLAVVFMGLTVAMVLGVPAGSWIAYTFGWRTAFWVVAGLASVMTAGLWFGVPRGLGFQAVRLSDLGAVLADGRLMLAILFTATYLGAIYVPWTYLATLMEAVMGLGRDGVTAALVVCGVGAVIGNLAGGWVADRLGAFRTLMGLACAQVAIMPLLSLLPLPFGLAVVLLLVWNAAGFGVMAAQQTRLVALSGPRAPVSIALNAACIYAGAAIGAFVGGRVVASAGLGALGVAGGVAATVAVLNLAASRRWLPRGAAGSVDSRAAAS